MIREVNFKRWAVLGVFMALIGSLPARASVLITVGSASANRGDIGDFLEVVLTNPGPGTQNIGAFNFEISVPSGSGITFTSVTTSTSGPYIFAGDSFAGPIISDLTPFPGPGQTIDASDLSNSGNGTNVDAGTTVVLGHVLFNVSGSAPLGPVSVTLNTITPGATSLSDSLGNNVTYTGNDGKITITGAVPEPSTLVLVWLAVPGLVALRRRLLPATRL
jgi:hypothetical protein